MAEIIGTAASIASLIGVGIKLSTLLFELATSLGYAGNEIKALGSDVALFCQILDQVESTLTRAKPYRVSLIAIQTTNQIINRCREILDAIKAIVSKLQRGDDSSSIERVARLKWTLKDRNKVNLLQESLKSCTGHLQLMVATMALAQVIADNRKSGAAETAEQEQRRSLTHSLILAQQSANERLEELETASTTTDDPDSIFSGPTLLGIESVSAPTSPVATSMVKSRHKRNRSSQMIGGSVYQPSISSDEGTSEVRRLSAFLNNSLHQNNPSEEGKRLTWASVTNHRQSVLQCDALLRSWTDQKDPLLDFEDSAGIDPGDDQASTPIPSPVIPKVVVQRIRDSISLLAEPVFAPVDALEVLTSTSKSIFPPPSTALPENLRMYDMIEYGRDYIAYVIWGDQDEWSRLDQVPMVTLAQLEQEGHRPMFMLRRLRPGSFVFSKALSQIEEASERDHAALLDTLTEETNQEAGIGDEHGKIPTEIPLPIAEAVIISADNVEADCGSPTVNDELAQTAIQLNLL